MNVNDDKIIVDKALNTLDNSGKKSENKDQKNKKFMN